MLINQELQLSLPEYLREMSSEEKQKLQMMAEGQGKVFSDEEKHIILSVGWKRLGGLQNLIVGRLNLVKHMENAIRVSMEPYRYSLKEQTEWSVGGIPAKGVRYNYWVLPENEPETEMRGESLVVKKGKTIYYLHFYIRENLAAENASLWSEIVASASWT